MPKFQADEWIAESVVQQLHVHEQLRHLRTRHRADVVNIESGPVHDAVKHARLKRVGVHLWLLEIADHRGRWEPTGVRTQIEAAVATLMDAFGWVLEPIDEDPMRTSDPQD